MADSNLSKNIQTVVVALATSAIGWMAYSVQELKVGVAVLAEKVDRLEHREYAEIHSVPLTPLPNKEPRPEIHALPANYSEPRVLRK